MITNNKITYYHKTLGQNKIEKWERHVFSNVWCFAGKGSGINAGYQDANDANVRIPMGHVQDKTIFAIGDIIAVGVQPNITKQKDLQNVEFYNVTSINMNDFGNNPHVHLGAR